MDNVLITICARGGSKGIPGKNIKKINGEPLIAYTIYHAINFSNIISADIALSTDSLEIKKIASEYGIDTDYIRKAELADDKAGKLGAIADLLFYEEKKNKKKYDYIVDLDVTSPLRSIEDLENAFNYFKNNTNSLNLFSVSLAKKNPYFNMVEKKSNGYYSLVKYSNDILSRQTAPKVYDMNASFYIYRRKYFELGLKTAISDKSLIYEMKHNCFDLDEPIDFSFMEFLLQNKLLDFNI